jgi:HD-like signal output (HDOD) protein
MLPLRIRRAVEDPNVDSKGIERIVTADPVVAARLIQVANSAAYALIKLGFSTTREIVTSIVLKQLFSTESPVLKRAMDDIWHHSTAVAAISFHLAKELSGFSPDRALLASLVHDIGALPLIGATHTHGYGNMSTQALKRCIDSLRGQLGAMVLRRWEFPDDMVAVALEAEHWHRDDTPTADYCDLVMVAQIFSIFGKPKFSKFPQVSTLPAFARLTKGELSVDDTIGILNDAQSDIEDLQKVLCA